MLHDLEISQSVKVQATPAKVWNALTEPEIIKEYLYGTETITDWKVGSGIIFQGEYEGQEYQDKGIVVENESEKKISYRYWSQFSGLEDKPENYSLITYTIKNIDDGKTEFTWTQKGYANEKSFQHTKTGMTEFLESIKAVMER